MNTNSNKMPNLIIDEAFLNFINQEVLPLTSLNADDFWTAVENIIYKFAPKNIELLEKRERLQKQIDEWHQNNEYQATKLTAYKDFLTDIGYLLEEGEDFAITTENVDAEIASLASPQLVVPLKNARYSLNAVNARWGSLYDALYGSDIIPQTGELEATAKYNPVRGDAVILYSKQFLDQAVPLEQGSHKEVTAYKISNQALLATLDNGATVGLKTPAQFIGYNGLLDKPHELLLQNNGLHIQLNFAYGDGVAKGDLSSLNDILIESALTTIMDCEDSIAAVDTEDKIEVYKNWLGLITGDLSETFSKGGKSITRKINEDSRFKAPNGESFSLRRRSLMFIRNVGHLMTIDTIKYADTQPIPEGILDGIFTSLIGSIELDTNNKNVPQNSQKGSIYIVKPKMHGPEEVQFTCDLFSAIEYALGLSKNTLKIGIMDEERRTTINLKECIRAAKERCVFINTGFLDRTGDEIQTSMEAGAFLPKDDIKAQAWIDAYEKRNVETGLSCGLSGKAQIGKGMWPKPALMTEMMESKIGHPMSGANTAWVPSPTAATLHALHYHEVDVFSQQETLKTADKVKLDDILTIPLMKESPEKSEVIKEVENNVQSILGYVVRWIDQGIGCSTVPDMVFAQKQK